MPPVSPSILLTALVVLLACAAGTPNGPVFEPLVGPAEGRALVYVYRRDEAFRSGSVRLRMDSHASARLLDGEYTAFELEAGIHELALTLRTAWGLPQGWNRVRLDAAEGDTIYLRVWADFAESVDGSAANGGDFAAPGRASRQASLNVFAARRAPAEALSEIRSCRLASADAAEPVIP